MQLYLFDSRRTNGIEPGLDPRVPRVVQRILNKHGQQWTDFLSGISPLWWPSEVRLEDQFVACERDFHDYLVNNRAIWRRLGWETILKLQPGLPDVIAQPRGSISKLFVELEYDATNFVKHGHTVAGIHLILSFKRPRGYTTVRGVPVWSFYAYELGNPKLLQWTLGKDIRNTGKNHEDDLEATSASDFPLGYKIVA